MDTRRALAHIQRATELLGFGSSQSRKAQQKGAAFGVIEGGDAVEVNLESVRALADSQPPEAGQLFKLVFVEERPPGGLRRRIAVESQDTGFRLRYKRWVLEEALTNLLMQDIPLGAMVAQYTLERDDTTLGGMTIPVSEDEVSEVVFNMTYANAKDWIKKLPRQVSGDSPGKLLMLPLD